MLFQICYPGTLYEATFTTENPEKAYELLCQAKPQLRTPTYQKIFIHTLRFLNKVERGLGKSQLLYTAFKYY
ncbi:thiamine biosynthesis protein NMT-1 [Rickettsiella massiliensis]|uniref:thiamine biosynthesis protein NMT-1 n=1 Tax=Rickettsiella massiliensis TaxID=676517 RepID=UPI000299FC10|nr:thiamine biosynthesis protein NMT-1 [Rickettsiella massiliensis]